MCLYAFPPCNLISAIDVTEEDVACQVGAADRFEKGCLEGGEGRLHGTGGEKGRVLHGGADEDFFRGEEVEAEVKGRLGGQVAAQSGT